MSKTHFFICKRFGRNYSIKGTITLEGLKIPGYLDMDNVVDTSLKLSQLKKEYNTKDKLTLIVPFCYDIEAPGYWVQCVYECENQHAYENLCSQVNKRQCLCGRFCPNRTWVSELTNEEYHEIDA